MRATTLRRRCRALVVWAHPRLQSFSGARRLVMRSLRLLVHPRAGRRWLACYGIDRDEPTRREAFVARVAAELGQL